jgi:hypothetical protein
VLAANIKKMITRIFGAILTAICLTHCSQLRKVEQSGIVDADSTEKESERTRTEIVDTAKMTDHEVSNCIRGKAGPVVRKTVYSKSTFKLNEDNRTATESIEFSEEEKLVIHNWGCEYYALTFRFETERFHADTTDINFWIDKGLLLMKEIRNGVDTPLDIPGGEVALQNYLTKNEYKLGDRIDYGNETISNTVTIDRIQKINDKKFAIELTYSIGPL